MAHEIPLPFERFGYVAAAGAVCFAAGLFGTLYLLIFKRRTP
jgi:hypothetical protein